MWESNRHWLYGPVKAAQQRKIAARVSRTWSIQNAYTTVERDRMCAENEFPVLVWGRKNRRGSISSNVIFLSQTLPEANLVRFFQMLVDAICSALWET